MLGGAVDQIALVVLEVLKFIAVGEPHGLSFQVSVVLAPELRDAAFRRREKRRSQFVKSDSKVQETAGDDLEY